MGRPWFLVATLIARRPGCFHHAVGAEDGLPACPGKRPPIGTRRKKKKEEKARPFARAAGDKTSKWGGLGPRATWPSAGGCSICQPLPFEVIGTNVRTPGRAMMAQFDFPQGPGGIFLFAAHTPWIWWDFTNVNKWFFG